jgi:hypothetical protein
VLALLDDNIAVTVSIGVSAAHEASSLRDLLKQADVALYDAKREGRNRVCLYNARNILRASFGQDNGALTPVGSKQPRESLNVIDLAPSSQRQSR